MSDEVFTPRPVPNAVPRDVTVAGCLFPCMEDNQPSLLTMPGTEDYFFPVFDSEAAFASFIELWPIPFDKLMVVDNTAEFLDSIPREIRVILNPRPHEDGSSKVQFTELLRP